MAQMFDCKAVAAAILNDCRREAETVRAKGIVPKLVLLRVGEAPADLAYELGAVKAVNEAGIAAEIAALPADATEEAYVGVLRKLNEDPAIHGILCFRPLKNIADGVITGNLNPVKDVEAVTPGNIGKVLLGEPGCLRPCTPEAILETLDYHADALRETLKKGADDDLLAGRSVCILNCSNVVGKPLAMMLLGRRATVSLVNTKTLPEQRRALLRSADVIVVAAPARNVLRAEEINRGAIVIDAGLIQETLCDENGQPLRNGAGKPRMKFYGSAAADVADQAAWLTPVPGIGGITSAVLARNVLRACKMQNGLRE